MSDGRPFDDIRALVAKFRGPDRVVAHVAARDEPGRAGDILRWMAAWSGGPARMSRPLVAVFAATHGIAESLKPGTVERSRSAVELLTGGHGGLNRACAAADLGLKVFDLALDMPTGDISAGPALDERGCAATMAFGMEAIAGGTDLLVLGASGEGGEIAAAALLSALLGERVADEVAALPQEIGTRVAAAVRLHAGTRDPLELMARLGGREVAAIAGAIVAARMERVPVLLDGITSVAAAVVLRFLADDAVAHCRLGDAGAIPLQRRAAELIGLEPVIDLGVGAGEGTGGAIAAAALKALVAASSLPQQAGNA